MLEPELIAKLEEESNPESQLSNLSPVYDYCGRVIGYTNVITQGSTATSAGGTITAYPTQPGLAGLSVSGQIVHTAPSTTTNLAGTTTSSSTTSGGAANLGAITVSTASASLSPSLTYNSTTGSYYLGY